MGWKNTEDFKSFHGRRSQRYAEVGRSFEQQELPKVLEKMKTAGEIDDFAISIPLSEEDRNGCDCRIEKTVDGAKVTRCLGVTISLRRWSYAKIRYPNVPQFCFPIGTKHETIRKRLLEIFL